MSKFVQSVVMEPLEFKGEKITATLRPIKRKLFSQLLPVMLEFRKLKDENPDTTDEALGNDPRVQDAMGRALDIAAPLIPEHVVEFKAPTDAEGKPVPLPTVLDAAYFLPVAMHMVMALIKSADVGEGAAGESVRPSAA